MLTLFIVNNHLRAIKQVNLLISTVVSLSILFLDILSDKDLFHIIFFGVIHGTWIFCSGLVLLVILKFCASRYQGKPRMFQIVRYSCSYLGCFLIMLLLYTVTGAVTGAAIEFENSGLIAAFIVISALLASVLMVIHNFIIVFAENTKTKLEFSELKAKNAEAENLLLRQQIHPHFLFNALSTVKSLYNKDVELGEEYLIYLADFLRSAVSHNHATATSLSDELALCKNYLKMQRMRFGAALEWEINISSPNALQCYVPAFSIQPLLENAIKHNIISTDKPLRILIGEHEGVLCVENNIIRKTHSDSSTGSGLGNLSERYLLWSGEHLDINDDGIIFKVIFKILKSEGCNN